MNVNITFSPSGFTVFFGFNESVLQYANMKLFLKVGYGEGAMLMPWLEEVSDHRPTVLPPQAA